MHLQSCFPSNAVPLASHCLFPSCHLARDFKNIIAIKEASGNITQMDDIIKNKPANFDVISGDDGITFPLITLGAVGVILVVLNI